MIYLLEDDDSIRKLVIYALQSQGYEAAGFERPSEFWHAMGRRLPELVLLDVMLPEEDGLSVLKKLRSATATAAIPASMLTAKNTEFDRVTGLDCGADDFVSKPFGMMELVARVRAVLRRTQDAVSSAEHVLLSDGPISLDERAHTVCVSGQPVQLTLKEYQLLTLLMKNQGAVLTRDVLLENIWGYGSESETRTVDVHIKRLREKLEGVSDKWALKTVWGVGYKFEAEET